jgi:hypothetical protein
VNSLEARNRRRAVSPVLAVDTTLASLQSPPSTRRPGSRLGFTDVREVGEQRVEQVGGQPSSVDLFWIPLGAGGRFVQLNGKAFEAISALIERRAQCDLYHSALEVAVDGCRFVIEQTPATTDNWERRAVCEGPVGARWAGRFRLFRYEIRRWQNGTIPDADFAVASPVRLTDDGESARRLLDLVPLVPTLTWGRDEIRSGEMWNSNSVISWLLERAGIDIDRVQPPTRGRAPGWQAGIVAARRFPTLLSRAPAARLNSYQRSALR